MKLPERFVAHGEIGRGGQAVVLLATDTLRGERVALKVVHPHLASDPVVRRRLQREVRAASLLHSDAALVPYDLHEVDGTVALSMPFHPGRTVAELVATRGALPADQVRAIGIRVARALVDAHGAGLLHRDVSANNVMVGEDPATTTVLADFGLARVAGRSATATRAAGTLGYAAPEVLSGGRADARSDLYGLGAVLYLAATGRAAFGEGGLARQLSEPARPVRELRPDLPADLAATIDALLARDPEDRPQGAAELKDALEQALPFRRVAPVRAPTAAAAPGQGSYFRPGRHAVVLREGDHDHQRRQALRQAAKGTHQPRAVVELQRWGTHVASRVREALGIPPADPTTPEQKLVHAVAAEAGFDPGRLRPSRVLLKRRFVLLAGVEHATAERLAEASADAGFRAEVVEERALAPQPLRGPLGALVLAAALWVGAGLLPPDLGGPAHAVAAMTAMIAVFVGVRSGRRPDLERLPHAYDPRLVGALIGPPPTPAFTTEAPPPPPSLVVAPPPRTRGQQLAERAGQALAELEVAADDPELPEPARADLRTSATQLRARATALAEELDALERVSGAHGASDEEIGALSARLSRLRALQAAGEPGDPEAAGALERAIAQHEADRAAGDELESRIAACTARLLEIGSTASRVRRELLAAPREPVSVDRGLDRLHAQARALAATRRETR